MRIHELLLLQEGIESSWLSEMKIRYVKISSIRIYMYIAYVGVDTQENVGHT